VGTGIPRPATVAVTVPVIPRPMKVPVIPRPAVVTVPVIPRPVFARKPSRPEASAPRRR